MEHSRNPGGLFPFVCPCQKYCSRRLTSLGRGHSKIHFLLSLPILPKHQAMGLATASERPASVRYNNHHSALPRHGIYTPCTSNTMATRGLGRSPDGTTTSLLMVVDTRPIRLQHIAHRESNNEGRKTILGLSWIARDMKRTNPRRP
jgi:hypothetical protein